MAKVHEKATNGSTSINQGSASGTSVSSAKNNICVVFPGGAKFAAEALERRDHDWVIRSKVASDLIIQVEGSRFHLHKIPMVSRSGYLNRLVFQRMNNRKKDTVAQIKIENFPGGAKIFEMVVKFCYGWKIDLAATNIAPVLCAAQYLEMTDDFGQGNLISKTEAFMSFILFSSWKDIFRILKSCENITSWSKELKILKRCSEAIAWKSSLNPKTFGFSGDDTLTLNAQMNDPDKLKNGWTAENWWFEDVSRLRVDQFVEVIESIKRRGVKSELVGSCIASWTKKWLSRIHSGLENLPKHLTHQFLRVTAESLIRALPDEPNSVSCNFLLHLLKLGVMMKVSSELLNRLEGRASLMLEKCDVNDLLVKNYGNSATVYDVGVVMRVVKRYVSSSGFKNSDPNCTFAFGKLMDRYLMVVSRDEKLPAGDFQSLAEALPKNARNCHDNLYKSIDMYLKLHPGLTEEERSNVCKAMNFHKLSKEARQHAVKNGRLSVEIQTRLILHEQVNMTRFMTATGSSYQRTRTEGIIKASNKTLEKKVLMMTPKKQIKIMKKEVQNMKVQLDRLEMCKLQLQKQVNVKRCII